MQIEYIGTKGRGQFFTISNESLSKINGYNWHLGSSGYAVTSIGGKSFNLQNFLMDCPKGKVVDHINGDKSNYQLNNLRICGHIQNVWNQKKRQGTSQYKGVTWNKRLTKWVAQMMCKGKKLHLGVFSEEIEAAKAYDSKAQELFGEYAYLNFKTCTKVSSVL